MESDETELTWDDVEDALRPLCLTDEGATNVYRAFCNVVWVPVERDVSYAEDVHMDDEGAFSCSWRQAAAMAADLTDGEAHYLDFYSAGSEGYVDPSVREALLQIGLKPVWYERRF